MTSPRRSVRLLRSSSTSQWSDPPPEILDLIAERINSVEDFFIFGGVCKSWHSAFRDKVTRKFNPKAFPWLMFPQNVNHDTQRFHNLLDNKFHRLTLNFPINNDICCWGSPYGWVIVAHDLQQVELVNPLSHVRISLPPLPLLHDVHHLDRFHCRAVLRVLSPDSPPDQHLVTIVFPNGQVAFAKPSDIGWTVIETQDSTISDILYLNDQLYFANTEGFVRCVDINGHLPNPVALLPPKGIGIKKDEQRRIYLLEMLGEMHMVVKFLGVDPDTDPALFEHYQTYFFKVFKLDFDTREWNELSTLEDHVIFLGNNTSFSLLVSNYPQCNSGSIYFTEHWLGDQLPHGNMGIFNVQSKELEPLAVDSDGHLCSPPIWFTPKLF